MLTTGVKFVQHMLEFLLSAQWLFAVFNLETFCLGTLRHALTLCCMFSLFDFPVSMISDNVTVRRSCIIFFRLDSVSLSLHSSLRPLFGQLLSSFGCLTSQWLASVSQGWACSDNLTCCHTVIEVACLAFYLTQSQYTDTGASQSQRWSYNASRLAE